MEKPTTYPKMNKQICAFLRMSDQLVEHYAAARIEELEAKYAKLRELLRLFQTESDIEAALKEE